MTVRACSTALASRGKTGDDLADPSGGGKIRDESMLISTTRLTNPLAAKNPKRSRTTRL